MKKRYKITKQQSKKNFRRGAQIHKSNLSATPLRGGWRL